MARTQWTTFTVRTDILQGLGWATIAEHLGYRSVGAWLTALAEERHHEFYDAGYAAAERRRALYALSPEEGREKPLKVNVRRAYVWECARLYRLALATPELAASARVFMDQAAFYRALFEVQETATLVAERRARILGFLNATIERRSARLVMLAVRPEWRRRGIATALYTAFRDLLPKEIMHIGAYVPVESPALVFFERLGFVHGKQYVWMERAT